MTNSLSRDIHFLLDDLVEFIQEAQTPGIRSPERMVDRFNEEYSLKSRLRALLGRIRDSAAWLLPTEGLQAFIQPDHAGTLIHRDYPRAIGELRDIKSRLEVCGE